MTTQRHTASAPGRLDVLGGVADYSGALVLQTPIQAVTRVTITATKAPEITLESRQEDRFVVPSADLRAGFGTRGEPAAMRETLQTLGAPGWTRYVLGCLGLHAHRWRWWPGAGLQLTVDSNVPASMGVSSSAALEVATLRALAAFSGHDYPGTELARTAQRAENEIVGAPCGLMDQLASAHGQRGALLPILCRPDGLSAPVRLPAGWIVVGWPSGVKHAVSASPYATARAAAFMGRRLAEEALGRRVKFPTEFHPSELRRLTARELPVSITGREFTARFGGLDDPMSRVDPARRYPVRAAFGFSVEEHFRTSTAAALLAARSPEAPALLGEMMFQSHAGYSAMGLGSPETDAMVDAVRALGAKRGFSGARVSGGGSGGTVVVLLRRDALPTLERLARRVSFRPEGPAPLIH